MVASTFQVQDRETQQAPILGQHGTDGWGTLPTAIAVVGASATAANGACEFETIMKSFNNALSLGVAETLNNSRYILQNGNGIGTSTYIVGNTRLNY